MDDQAGDRHEVESETTHVVYDAESGAILHIHRATTFRGAERPPEHQDEERAVDLARRSGHEGELRALPVDTREIDLRIPHRVDLDDLRLVPDRPAEAS
jgi:hypothetical protein